jgi:hypothetical protein
VLPECALCGELNPSALMRRACGFVCANCEADERGRPGARCARCGLTAPFERHHVESRRNSPRTAPLCLNCHRIAHAADMRRTLRGAGAAIPQIDRSPNAEGHGPIAGAGEIAGGQRATVRGGTIAQRSTWALASRWWPRGDGPGRSMARCSTGATGPGGAGLGWSQREISGNDEGLHTDVAGLYRNRPAEK